jgi:hypothetical protein
MDVRVSGLFSHEAIAAKNERVQFIFQPNKNK